MSGNGPLFMNIGHNIAALFILGIFSVNRDWGFFGKQNLGAQNNTWTNLCPIHDTLVQY